jgi:ABC-type lipoprotein export system ATPase subunit
MNDPRGSLWRVWDLHVHTPDSIIQKYGPRNEETWEKFLENLESLPHSIRVLGINDYIFLDGYRRVLAEKKKGRLSNIDLLLPVIELRLDKFGGTDSNLNRVNFHVIFSDELSTDTIQEQFINALTSNYVLSPEYDGSSIKWGGVPTKNSLEDLGNKIIESVPQAERRNFGTPIIEGFNALSVSLDNVRKILDGPYLKGKHLTAVGKTEWWNIKWNDKSIAEKKNIINFADLVFVASNGVKNYQMAKESLKAAGVNDRLLDCSDAHSLASSKEKDRLGNCFTWLKADPTFQGLRQVIIEPEERIFVGEIPQQVSAVENNKTKYVKSVSVKKVTGGNKTTSELWFNAETPLNHGLVAIIGNKGSGKSALGDILGLLGNSRQQRAFSFLHSEKFKKPPENKARFFEAKIEWESGESWVRNLDYTVDTSEVERIKYIPQNYFEDICNQLGSIEETAFDKELKKVIFSHVSEPDKLAKTSLDELISYKSGEIKDAINVAKRNLEKINRQIVDFEKQSTQDFRESLENQLNAKRSELKAVQASKPRTVKKPSKKAAQQSSSLKSLENKLQELQQEVIDNNDMLGLLTAQLNKMIKIEGKIGNFSGTVDDFFEEIEELTDEFELNIRAMITVKIDSKPLLNLKEKLSKEKERVQKLLDKKDQNSLYAQIERLGSEIEGKKEKLDKPSKDYQKYQDELSKWEKSIKDIEGSDRKPDTIFYLEKAIEKLSRIPEQINGLENKRLGYARKVYKLILKQKNILQELYAPVQKFISEHPDIGEKIELNFGASIMNLGFSDSLAEWINMSKAKFLSGHDGRKLLDDLVISHDFNDEESVIKFAEEVNDMLHSRHKYSESGSRPLAEILKNKKTVESLYDFLYAFEYLDARYVLKLGEKELKQLSPGERGALLIVFYLLIDLDTAPLIIDQPEHNLDNETLTRLLVPAIKKAKKRRQIIIITHNPILAVVCNADQIIAASLNIKSNYKLEYIAGSIESPAINKRIVDVLEGTMSSFDNRQRKYIREYLDTYIKQ